MSTSGRAEQIKVSLLGDLQVVRVDGSLVQAHEWRTGKTMDLFRLLALSNGHPVRTAGLIDKLWPRVSERRANNSLRTAVSQIRRTVSSECIDRQREGLVLSGCWVDVADFTEHARVAHRAHADALSDRVLEAATAGEELYRGDFHAHDDESVWASATRESFVHTRAVMLTEASAAALALDLLQTSVDLGEIALGLDPSSGSVVRSLMEAYSSLGEPGRAMQVFARHRSHLADELGIDPAGVTSDLHVRLLRSGS